MAIHLNRPPSLVSLTDGARLSISEPSLTDIHQTKHFDRFIIKHPYEYISVDDLKYFRRRKSPDFLTKSQICLCHKDDANVLPLKSEYKRQYLGWNQTNVRTLPIRRSTSLRLEGLMPLNTSEYRDRYILYTPEDCKSCRTYPIRKPESLHWHEMDMEPKYSNSSFITPPMIDDSMKILPREAFKMPESKSKDNKSEVKSTADETEIIQESLNNKKSTNETIDPYQGDSVLERAYSYDNHNRKHSNSIMPSEYKQQYIQFPIEKAHSIPQIGHLKIQGNFQGVPEYKDSFKQYANYVRPAAYKKPDNLILSGSEIRSKNIGKVTVPEYRDKFNKPASIIQKEKPLKVPDHLHVSKEGIKNVPEYNESFRPPPHTQIPERGKCPESHLQLKGKLEFDPEYRNVYLDFPRSRPTVPKPISTFHLPTSSSTTTDILKLPKTNRRLKPSPPLHSSIITKVSENADNDSEAAFCVTDFDTTQITKTPEYRRATYNYQIRKRSPDHKLYISEDTTKSQPITKTAAKIKGKTSQFKQTIPVVRQQPVSTALANYGLTRIQKTPKFGRRASALRNADNCRERTSIIEGNPKYKINADSIYDSFLVLDNNHLTKR